jgi:hypothetical protein
MVAVELQAEISTRPQTPRSRKVTLERRKVTGKQLRFNWDEKESGPKEPVVEPIVATTAKPSNKPSTKSSAQPQSSPISAATKSRIGDATKLGVVMLRLLKSYGISDEEIIEGLSMPTVG